MKKNKRIMKILRMKMKVKIKREKGKEKAMEIHENTQA